MKLVTLKPVKDRGGHIVAAGSLIQSLDGVAQLMLRDGVARVLSKEEHERRMREVAVGSTNVRASQRPVRSASEDSYIYITDLRQLNEALQGLKGAKVLALDTETTGLDPYLHQPRLLQLTARGGPNAVIDLWKIPTAELSPLRDLLREPSLKIGHNLKFDLKMLWQAGLPVSGPFFDTMLAAQLLDAGVAKKGHTLAELVAKHCQTQLSKEMQTSDWSGSLTEEQYRYAAEDVVYLADLHSILSRELEAAGLTTVAELEFACLPAVAEIELTGMKLDREKWEGLVSEFEARKEEAYRAFQEQLPEQFREKPINPNSPTQLAEVFRKLGVPADNTKKETLFPLVGRFPVLEALLKYRSVSGTLSRCLRPFLNSVHPVTGRLHGDYHQLGADTGRFSCSHPPLQQIPKGVEFRRCFVAEAGRKLIAADYSQIELRIAAEISHDEQMIRSFKEGRDMHRMTASLIAHKPYDEVTKDERQRAKALNFGMVYGMSAAGLVIDARVKYGVKMTKKEAESHIKAFFNGYPQLAAWYRKTMASKARETRTLSGRRRLWPGSQQPPPTELLNTPVQGTGADCMKRALGMLPERLEGTGAKIIATIHDEIIVEAPEERAQEVEGILKETMEEAASTYLTHVPVAVDVSVGDSWGEK
jgi:DNA polymerase I